jgi:hypothetical protein
MGTQPSASWPPSTRTRPRVKMDRVAGRSYDPSHPRSATIGRRASIRAERGLDEVDAGDRSAEHDLDPQLAADRPPSGAEPRESRRIVEINIAGSTTGHSAGSLREGRNDGSCAKSTKTVRRRWRPSRRPPCPPSATSIRLPPALPAERDLDPQLAADRWLSPGRHRAGRHCARCVPERDVDPSTPGTCPAELGPAHRWAALPSPTSQRRPGHGDHVRPRFRFRQTRAPVPNHAGGPLASSTRQRSRSRCTAVTRSAGPRGKHRRSV